MKEKSYLVAVGFAGAGFALLAAKYLFGATGTDTPENIAFLGFVVSFGTHIFLRLKTKAPANG